MNVSFPMVFGFEWGFVMTKNGKTKQRVFLDGPLYAEYCVVMDDLFDVFSDNMKCLVDDVVGELYDELIDDVARDMSDGAYQKFDVVVPDDDNGLRDSLREQMRVVMRDALDALDDEKCHIVVQKIRNAIGLRELKKTILGIVENWQPNPNG